MPFISVVYLIFLAFAASVYYLIPHKYRALWLLFVSYFFYITWQPAFLLILIGETFCAYWFGKRIAEATSAKRKWLTVSVIFLFLPLVFFKYYNFLNENLTGLLGSVALENPLSNQPFLVPLGISFFTFLAVSYVADVYRGYLKPEARLDRIALYMAFFPTILAGPIERARSMFGQFSTPTAFEYENIRAGLQLILWGVFKKVVLADRMKDFMDNVFANPQDFQGVLIYFAVAFSVFHLFCDFSAYSDMAVGSARIFGFKLSKNFDDRVYAAPSRVIFWQGWHRTLTSWLRDYVFFPLSKNVKEQSRLYLNLLVIYLLVGVWHGATWGFIVWGALNGVWLIIEHSTKKRREKLFADLGINTNGSVFSFVAWLFIFHVGAFFGVFFRIDSPDQAFNLLTNLANSNAGLFTRWETRSCVFIIILLIGMDLINRRIPANENFDAFLRTRSMLFRWACYIALSQLIIRYIHVFQDVGFMYFNF